MRLLQKSVKIETTKKHTHDYQRKTIVGITSPSGRIGGIVITSPSSGGIVILQNMKEMCLAIGLYTVCSD